ncbi:rod shape-determining protein RodA [Candidatus Omnitrophota bacterium]
MIKRQNMLIVLVVLAIMLIGLLAVYSATYQKLIPIYQHIFAKHLIKVFVAIIIIFLVSKINYRRFYDFAWYIYGLGVFLLVLVLFFGREILGAQRWFEFGFFNFQPSELVKFGTILVLSRYFCQKRSYSVKIGIFANTIVLFRELIVPFLLILLPMGLIFLQPDLGTALTLVPVFLSILLIANTRLKYLVSFLVAGLISLPVIWHFLKPYQKERLLVFLNPNIDPLGAGYTMIQSKIAVGSGRFFGKGWLSGTQNQLNFLPERHTDFVFSVIGEEWGVLGASILIALYFYLIILLFKVAFQTRDNFATYFSVGIIGLLTFQVVVNISMTLGLCPVVGLSLPFISYGGSTLIIFSVFIGILLNINEKRKIF